MDGTLGPAQTLTGPAYDIPAELGQLRGNNLFQSFGVFNIHAGESAIFSGPSNVQNIVNRVTGGTVSSIDGLLRSTIPGANLYLLNPSGVMVGPNAQLDVSGSVHLTSADVLRFADGTSFSAQALSPVLTVAEPAAFGFLGPAAGKISVQGSNLQVQPGKVLSLIGGDLAITNATLGAPSGRIQLAGVASPGDVVPFGPSESPGLRMDSFGSLGAIALPGATLTTRGDPGGTVLIRSGQLILNSSNIISSSAGAIDHPGLAIDIAVKSAVSATNGSEIAASSAGAGRAGNLRISAATLDLTGDPNTGRYTAIASRAFSSGAAGSIDIAADTIALSNNAFINAPALASGAGGSVSIRAGTLQLLDNGGQAFISTGTFATGEGGHLIVHADSLLARGGPHGFTGLASTIQGTVGASLRAGDINVTAGNLTLLDGAQISSSIFQGSGQGGSIEINANTVQVAGLNPFGFPAGIFSSAQGINALGKAGDIHVVAGEVNLADRGQISSALYSGSPAQAGNISIQAGVVDIRSRGFIAAASFFGTGSAGNLDIAANQITLVGVLNTTDPILTDFTGLSAGTTDGPGGRIRVSAGQLNASDNALITSVTVGNGHAGDILLDLGDGSLSLVRGGAINSGTTRAGVGGNIEINAGSVQLRDTAPFVSFANSGVSAIASQTTGTGAAGAIQISTKTLEIYDGGRITAESFGAGRGGDIAVSAGQVTLAGASQALRQAAMATSTEDPTIASSSIRVNANDPSTGAGNAGNLTMQASEIRIQSGGLVSSATAGPGAGGNISIEGNRVVLSDGSLSANSSGPGNAGNIEVTAHDALTAQGGSVTTQAISADGGNIVFTVGNLVHLVDSTIISAVGSGDGKGGNITIDPQFVVLDGSQIRADAFGGPGGNVRIVAGVFLTSGSTVSASSALGISGTVDVQAQITDLSGNVTQLPENGLQAAALLRQSCEARIAEQEASSLTVGSRDGLPPAPGDLQLSLGLLGDHWADAVQSNETADGIVLPLALNSRSVLQWPGRTGCEP